MNDEWNSFLAVAKGSIENKVNCGVDIDIKSEFPMYYDFSKCIIYLNPELIKQESDKFNLEASVYIKIMICHEIGHAVDTTIPGFDEYVSKRKELLERSISIIIVGNELTIDEKLIESSKIQREVKKIDREREIRAYNYGRTYVEDCYMTLYDVINKNNIGYYGTSPKLEDEDDI